MAIEMRIDRPEIMKNVSEEKYSVLVNLLEEMQTEAEDYRQNWDAVHQRNWKMYRCVPSRSVQTFPWKNAANYFIPVAAVTCDILKSMAFNAMFGQPPEIHGEGIEDEELARKLNRYIFNHVWKKQILLNRFSDGWNLDTIVDGTSAVKTWYDNSPVVIRDFDPVTKMRSTTETVTVMGEEVSVPVFTGDISIEVKEKIRVFNNAQPCAETVDLSYLFVAPGTRASLQYPDCQWYYEEMYKTWSDLQGLKFQGWEHIDEDLKATLREREPTDRESEDRALAGLSDKALPTARVLAFYMRLVLPGEFEIQDTGEVKRQRFMDEGGIEEEVIVYYLSDIKKIAMIVPLTRERTENQRPHIVNYWDRIDKHFYGQGMMDKMRYLQTLVNTSFNQMVDYGTLRNLPFFFFSPAQTGIMPDLLSIQPGEGIPVNDPRGITFPRFQGNDSHFQSLIMQAQQWVERVGNYSDLNAGRNAAGPNRTARGMFQLLEQTNQLNAYRIALWAEPYRQVFHQVFNLIRRHSPGSAEFTYLNEETGVLNRESIPPTLFQGDVDFTFNLNPNKVLRQQSTQNFFTLLMSIPQFVQQNPQGLRELAREVAVSFDMADKFDRLWPREQLQMQTPMPFPGEPGQPQQPESGFGGAMPGPGPNGSGFQSGGEAMPQ